MTTYTISPRSESDFTPFTVEADTHEAAATLAAKSLCKGRRNAHTVHARRETGIVGKSGVFQGYAYMKTGSETSVGGNFHVMAD